jgi:aspartate-semialdehyde dehydrogenase
MEHRIALSHASGVAAEAILEKLPESGITKDSLILLDHESNLGKRLPFAGGNLGLQDQRTFDLSSCALLLMPQADVELESAALHHGCLLVSHAIGTDTPPIFIADKTVTPDISYTQTSFRLVGTELSCLLPVLLELNRILPVEQLNVTLLRSAEFHGKDGVDELASQTINLLNSRMVESSVFEQQIAFNLLPDNVDPLFEADLRQIMGNSSYNMALQSVNVPIFHGLVAAVQLRFNSSVNFDDCKARLEALDQVIVKKGPVSPISDSNQSFSCVINRLEQSPDQPSSLQFWLIFDPMRYGLANNYVNVTDFLLKSFL